jgi:hypothetical protein
VHLIAKDDGNDEDTFFKMTGCVVIKDDGRW